MKKRGRPKVEGLEERRREEILCVAAQVFAERGYPGTDVQIVADKIGVGKGTVYRYFPTKEALFLAATDRGMRLLRAGVNAAASAATDGLGRIRLATRAYLEFFAEHPELVELFMQERAEFSDRKKPTYFVHRDENIGQWRKLFGELMKAGVVRKMPVERILNVMSDLLYGSIFTNVFAGRRPDPGRQAEEILDVILNGILGPKGKKR